MTEELKTELELEEELGEEHHYCFGCGVRLQTQEPKKRGYIPQNVLAHNGPVLCQRCFKIQHYAEDKNSEAFDKEGFLKDLIWRNDNDVPVKPEDILAAEQEILEAEIAYKDAYNKYIIELERVLKEKEAAQGDVAQ